jgi:hypothetical protein
MKFIQLRKLCWNNLSVGNVYNKNVILKSKVSNSIIKFGISFGNKVKYWKQTNKKTQQEKVW